MSPETPTEPCSTCYLHPEYRSRMERAEERIDRLETRFDVSNEKMNDVWAAVSDLKAQISNLNGRLAGYLVAAGILGTVVAVIAQLVMTKLDGVK